MDIEDAISRTLDEMPQDFLIYPYMLGNKAEVKNMCITEYNEAETMELMKKAAIAEGLAQGIAEGMAKGEDQLGSLIQLLLSKGLTADIQKAVSDKNAREELYLKYGIKNKDTGDVPLDAPI